MPEKDPTPLEIRFTGNLSAEQKQTALDYFAEWIGEGGLVEAFNEPLQAEHNMSVQVTGSGSNYFFLTVYEE